MGKIHKLTKEQQTIYPATITDAVVHPDLKVSTSKLIEEINVSKLFPTGGIDGSNKYTLETAIAKIPKSLQTVGIKCSFLGEDGELEIWEYQGGTFTLTKNWWKQIANPDLINRGIFMPDSSLVNLNNGVILDFKIVTGIDEAKEYYIAYIRPKNPLIQIQDETGAVVAQYYPNTQDTTATGIETFTLSAGGKTERFQITVNWDAVGDKISFGKSLHINKKNVIPKEEKNLDLINRGIFMPDSNLYDLPAGAVLNFGVVSGIKEEKEYYLSYVYAKTGLVQIVDQDGNIVSQYYNNGQKSGIEQITVGTFNSTGGNTEVFRIFVNWDAAGDFRDSGRLLHINKKNYFVYIDEIAENVAILEDEVEDVKETTLNKEEFQETLVVNDKFNGVQTWGLDHSKRELFIGKILAMWGDELPEEPIYIAHIQNKIAEHGVLIQIATTTNAEDGTVISQYDIASPSEVKTGIEDIVLTKVGTNGKEFHMTVDWDNISDDIRPDYIQVISLPKTKSKGNVESRLDDAESRLDDVFEPLFYDTESPDLTYVQNGVILDVWNVNCPSNIPLYLGYLRNNDSPIVQFWSVQGDHTKILAQYYKANTQPQTGIQDVEVTGLSDTPLKGCSFIMRINWDLIGASLIKTDLVLNTSILRKSPNSNAFGRIHELEESSAPKYLQNELYLNVFGDVIPESFKKKWFNAEKDLEILLLGDSLVGLENSSGEIPESEAMFLPPSMNYYHWTWGLWQRIVKNKPVYDRLDAVRNETPSFTQTGDFEFVGTAGDGDKFNEPSTFGEWSVAVKTFQCNAANASVQFSWDLDSYEKLNIIHSLNPDGAPCKITVSGGDGKIEVSIDKSSWVEANNFAVDQNSNPDNLDATQCSQQGHTLHQRHRRIWMRRKEGAVGIQMITFARTDSDISKYMYFWGTERWNQATVIIQNIGRGGRTTALLNQNISDVVDRNPDLVIHSLSLANEQNITVGTPEDKNASLMRDYNDFFFGGNETRPEYINPRSMLTKSDNYTKWAYLVVIPHGRGTYFDGNTLKNESTDLTMFPYYKYRKIGEYIRENGEAYDGLSIINLFDQLIHEGMYRGMTMEDTFSGISQNPGSFTSDGIHLNGLGSLMWTKYLSPLFDKI